MTEERKQVKGRDTKIGKRKIKERELSCEWKSTLGRYRTEVGNPKELE